MRRVATILFASVAGIHCTSMNAAGDDPIAAGDVPEIVLRDEGKPTPADEEAPPPTWHDRAVKTADTGPAVVGDDGAKYVAGTFSGEMTIGKVRLRSRGEDDIFVARFEPNGSLAWARAVGGAANESGPSLRFVEGRVQLVATSLGQVDCGRGPLASWSSEMFFFCYFEVDGASSGGAAFPTGTP